MLLPVVFQGTDQQTEFGPPFAFVSSFIGTQSHPGIYEFVSGCPCSTRAAKRLWQRLWGLQSRTHSLTFNRKGCPTSSFEKTASLYFFKRLKIFWLDWAWSSTRLSSLPAPRDAIPEGTERGWCPWVVQPAALPSCRHSDDRCAPGIFLKLSLYEILSLMVLFTTASSYICSKLCLPKNIWLQNRRSHLWVTALLSTFQLGP